MNFPRILIIELWTDILLGFKTNCYNSHLINYHHIDSNPESKQHNVKWQPAKYKIVIPTVCHVALFDSLSLLEWLTQPK